MARTLLIGNPVITLGPAGLVTDGAVVVDGTTVAAVVPRDEADLFGPFDEVLGSADHLVLPGFVNGHYHSESPLGDGLWQYIFERANVEAGGVHLDSEALLRAGILRGLMNGIRGGQTSVVDMFYGSAAHPDLGVDVALEAYEQLGMRVAFGLVACDQNRFAHEPDSSFLARLPGDLAADLTGSGLGARHDPAQVLQITRSLLRRWDGRHGRVRIAVAPDWTPNTSDALYRQCAELATRGEAPLTTHALETRAEAAWNHRRGESALARLERLGVLGPATTLAHFVWATDDDIARLAATGTRASINPGSNLRLSAGIGRLRDILDAGGAPIIGTDGISVGDDEDFFAELRLAGLLQRSPRKLLQGRLDSERLLRAASQSGSNAIGRPGHLGEIAPGQLADLLVVDRRRIVSPPGKYATTPLLDALVDRGAARDVEHVMINGTVVLRGRRFTTVDEDEIDATLATGWELSRATAAAASGPPSRLTARLLPYLDELYAPAYANEVRAAEVYNARWWSAPGETTPVRRRGGPPAPRAG